MNRYFLPKTGWEFFDVTRAYGVGIIVHALSGDAVVSDMGGFYLIESRRELDFERIDNIHRFLGNDQAWNWNIPNDWKWTKRKDKKEGRRVLRKCRKYPKCIGRSRGAKATSFYRKWEGDPISANGSGSNEGY